MEQKSFRRAVAAIIAAATAFAAAAQSTPAPALVPATVPSAALFVVHLTIGPGWETSKSPSEQAGFKEHSENLAKIRADGQLVVGARYKDAAADKGMLVIRAVNREEVDALFARDPTIREQRFTINVAAFNPFYEGFIERPRRAEPANPLTKVAFIAGCWAARSSGREYREHWMPPAGGLMMGMVRQLRDGRAVSYESARLELEEDGTPVYIALPKGQSETRFKLKENDATSATFENAAHDFPQRVIYRLKDGSSLHARIEGHRDGKARAVDFPMSRISCD